MIWQLVEVYPSVAVWKCQEQDDGQWRTWWQATDHANGKVDVPSQSHMYMYDKRETALSAHFARQCAAATERENALRDAADKVSALRRDLSQAEERMTNARATYRAVCAHQDACKRELDAALKNLQACQRALSKEVW